MILLNLLIYKKKLKSLYVKIAGREIRKMNNVIETHHLTKAYGLLKAVDKLDITVETGEIFGLLGPNGAGKTTTISSFLPFLNPLQELQQSMALIL